MNDPARRAALIQELVAVIIDETADSLIEEFAQATGLLLRTGFDTATAATPQPLVYTDQRDLPQPEEGDEFSGLARERAIRAGAIPPADGIVEQDGLTEQEWEAAR